jgi:hypothetical protein
MCVAHDGEEELMPNSFLMLRDLERRGRERRRIVERICICRERGQFFFIKRGSKSENAFSVCSISI